MSLAVLCKNNTRQNITSTEAFIKEIASFMKPAIKGGEISILFCGDTLMKKLNYTYRGKNKTTDVLSFSPEMEGFLGDIVISIPKAKKQAKEGLREEIETLLCHGFLHLLGYDHEKGEEDYKIMMDLQTSLLEKAKVKLKIL